MDKIKNATLRLLLSWGVGLTFVFVFILLLTWMVSLIDRHMAGDSPPSPSPGQNGRTEAAETSRGQLERLRRIEDVAWCTEPKEGLRQLRDLKLSAPERRAFVRGLFQRAAADREAALTLAAKVSDAGAQADALQALLEAWNPEQACKTTEVAKFVYDHGPVVGLGLCLLGGSHPDVEAARAWCRVLAPAQGRGKLLGAIVYVSPEDDLRAALATGNGLSGREYLDFLNRVASRWARRDPSAIIREASMIRDPVSRDYLLRRLALHWVAHDPDKAAEGVNTVPDRTVRAAIVRNLVKSSAAGGGPATPAWIAGLPDAELRTLAQKEAPAPAAEGLLLTSREDAPPQVAKVPPDLKILPAGALHEGDVLVAIDPGDTGRFTLANDLPFAELTRLLDGDGNEAVGLRISSPGPGGYQPVRTTKLIPGRHAQADARIGPPGN